MNNNLFEKRLRPLVNALLKRKFVQDTITLQISKLGVVVLGMVAWVIVPVRLGPEGYGLFALAQSFLGIWQALNLTGLNTSTQILLSTAVGAEDEAEILDLLSVYVKVTLLWAVFSILVLTLIGPALAGLLYRDFVQPAPTYALSYPLMSRLQATGNTHVGTLGAFLALILFFDPIYNLMLTAFRSRRSMRIVGLLQNINQLVLTITLVAAALLHPTPAGQVVGRIIYSVVTMGIALVFYQRLRTEGKVPYPPLRAVMRRALAVSYRPYWRFGLANALDKNVANLYTQLPLQMVGIFAGPTAASYIQLGLRAINKTGVLTSAVFENMQSVVPQAVGRGDFAQLQVNFMRVLTVLTLGGLVFYGAFVLLAPLLVVPIFGEEWMPVLPLLPSLAFFGLVTDIGGIFGPLYRAFDLMRAALSVKIGTLVMMIPVGIWLIHHMGSLGGVWMIDGLFALSVALTAGVTLPVLRRHASQVVTLHG